MYGCRVGTWGLGNFDSDIAADGIEELVAAITAQICEQFEDPTNLYPDEWGGHMVPAWLEILVLFCEKGWLGSGLPPATTLAEWKQRYLETWDAHIDELWPKPGYKRDRRVVLESTFDRAICLSADQER